ncbi:MAG: hypothetical protein E7590_09870 [Ruminococcaceae bacterium]|nr:hypothetical protein [Oscillospiraceae bacterium]
MHSEEKNNAVVPAAPSENMPVPVKSGYWGRMAERYTWLWRILLIFLLVFSALFILLFSRAFTYDSIFCFFRDLRSVSSFVTSEQSAVTASFTEGDQTVLSYRGGIAFVNSHGVEIYSPTGERLLNAERTMKQPRAVASRKYLVAYDNGGTSFVITNSYAELYRGETEFPIFGAAVSDSGHFALITAAGETLSQVLLYDNNFNLIQRFGRASATVSVSLSDNGKRIAILGANATEGTVGTKLDIYRLGEADRTDVTMTFAGEIPLSVSFTNNRYAAVLTNKMLRCCDMNGELECEIAQSGAPVAFTANENGALLVTETDKISGTYRVLALDKRGDTVYDGEMNTDIHAVALGDEELFLLTKDQVLRIDPDDGDAIAKTVEEGANGLFVTDAGGVRVCYPAKAEYLFFEKT